MEGLMSDTPEGPQEEKVSARTGVGLYAFIRLRQSTPNEK